MKKLVSIALALVMILALGLSAMAADTLSGATTGDTPVKLVLDDACITWSIPDEISIDAETGLSSGEYEVSAVNDWRVEYGKVWVISLQGTGDLVLSNKAASAGIAATVSFNTLMLNEADTSTLTEKVIVSIVDTDSIKHLAGTYEGSITFQCDYEEDIIYD